MKYYKLIYDFENDNDYIGCTVSDKFNINQYIVCEGKKVDDWNDNTLLEFSSDEGDIESDYLANNYGWLVFSENFKKKMDCLIENDIQYLDIKIRNTKNQSELAGYKVVNVITVMDALDLENSKYDLFELDDEKIMSIEKYALKKDRIVNSNIFKLKDDTIPTFVSEKFKKIVEENNLTGFQFLEIKVV